MASITIKGVDALMKKLGKAAAIETLRPPMTRGVMRLQRDMADAPGPIAKGHWAANTTPGQRRAYFAKVKRLGKHPKRTGSAKRWTTKVVVSVNGLQGKVGISAKSGDSYLPFVYSDRFQAGFHRGRWRTDQQARDKNEPAIVADFGHAIDRALAGG